MPCEGVTAWRYWWGKMPQSAERSVRPNSSLITACGHSCKHSCKGHPSLTMHPINLHHIINWHVILPFIVFTVTEMQLRHIFSVQLFFIGFNLRIFFWLQYLKRFFYSHCCFIQKNLQQNHRSHRFLFHQWSHRSEYTTDNTSIHGSFTIYTTVYSMIVFFSLHTRWTNCAYVLGNSSPVKSECVVKWVCSVCKLRPKDWHHPQANPKSGPGSLFISIGARLVCSCRHTDQPLHLKWLTLEVNNIHHLGSAICCWIPDPRLGATVWHLFPRPGHCITKRIDH